MKTRLFKSLLTIVFLAIINVSFSQNIGINGSGSNPHASALLDVDAVATPSLGILIPRIALQAINLAAPISSPATSLLLYNTATASTGTNAVSPGYYYWDGIKWVRFAYNPSGVSSLAWNTLGNAGTLSSTNFLGTTDDQDLVFKRNNVQAGLINNSLGATSFGVGSLSPGSTGSNNTSMGAYSMASNTTGDDNTAIGVASLYFNTSGYDNSAFGWGSMLNNTTGNNNTSIGIYALAYNTSGFSNCATGGGSLGNNTTGGGNSSFGTESLYANLTGTNNTAIGLSAGSAILNTSGSRNTFLGAYSDVTVNNLTNATAIGYNAKVGASNALVLGGIGTDAVNVGIGITTPTQKLDVVGNVQFSNALMPAGNAGTAGQVLTSSGAGVAPTWTTVSQWALLGNAGTTAGTNFLGTTDAQDLVFKTNNTERWRVLQSATPTLRANANSLLVTKTGAGTNVIGFNNSASGIVIGDNNAFGGATSDIIIGNNANTGGGGPINSILLGSNFTTSGGGPSSSIFIGNSIATGGGGPINSIFIGNGINTGGAINTAVIGNTSMTSIGGQVGWSTLSDGRFKKNISDFNLGLSFITKLNPKSYAYNNNDNGIVYNGLIAQEVEKTLQDLGVNFSGLCLPTTKDDHYSIRYGDFVIPLINAVKEQQQQIEELKKQNAEIIKLLKKN